MTYSRQTPVSAGGLLMSTRHGRDTSPHKPETTMCDRRRIKRALRRHRLSMSPLPGIVARVAHAKALEIEMAAAGEHEALERAYFAECG